jgi:hypothetical protein
MKVKTTDQSHIYVLAEFELTAGRLVEVDGPVKLGMHEGLPARYGRPGLTAGNPRHLGVVHHHPVPFAILRWTEWLVHRRLIKHHVRGEWFEVRHLLNGRSWGEFLTAVVEGTEPDLDDWVLESSNCKLDRMERSPGSKKHFTAYCETHGAQVSAEAAMSKVLEKFAVECLGLGPNHQRLADIRQQIHHLKPEIAEVDHLELSNREYP